MAQRPPARPAPVHHWLSDAGDQIGHFRRLAEAKGREIADAAIRAGKPIVAKTTADIVELGAKALARDPRIVAAQAVIASAKSPQVQRTIVKSKDVAHGVVDQVTAAGRGAIDAGSFGAADYISSSARALVDSHGHLSELGARFSQRMDQERARDQYDEEHFGAARRTGEIGAVVGETFLLGPLGGIARGVQVARAAPAILRGVQITKAMSQAARLGRIGNVGRTKLAAGLVPRELAALGVIGGGIGGVERVTADKVMGRQTTPQDLIAAVAGGALQGVAAPRMGVIGNAAMGAGMASVLDDALNGRSISPGNAASSAALAGVVGMGVSRGVEGGLNHLSSNMKGKIGEALSEGRTLLRGGRVTGRQVERRLNSGLTTIIDHTNDLDEIVEAKLSKRFQPSRAQRAARAQYNRRSRFDHFLLRDLGLMSGAPAGQAAGSFAGQSD